MTEQQFSGDHQKRAFQGSKVRYLAGSGLNCLGCDSTLLLRGPTEFVNDEWRQGITCVPCGATWHNVYILSGIKITYKEEPSVPHHISD